MPDRRQDRRVVETGWRAYDNTPRRRSDCCVTGKTFHAYGTTIDVK